MVVADPAADLLRLVTAGGDPPPERAGATELAAARLIRRRFGLALPTPFVGTPGEHEPVRVAVAHDGAAIAAIKWRCFGANYRGGVLADDFLDGRDVVPPASYWTGRAMVPPSRRHRIFVWGRPGVVHGYLDAGPVGPEDAHPDRPDAGEVRELYVDPSAQGRGGGASLLEAATAWMADVGFRWAELSTLESNPDAQRFYAASGWAPTGEVVPVDLGVVAFREVRFARRL